MWEQIFKTIMKKQIKKFEAKEVNEEMEARADAYLKEEGEDGTD